MKKLALLVACFMVIAGLTVAGCGGDETTTTAAPVTTADPNTTAAPDTTTTEASAEAQVIKLRVATEKPPGHLDMTDNLPGFFRMVEAATNGKYKFEVEYFPINTLLATADLYDGVVKGIVDVVQTSLSATPQRFPVMNTLSVAGIAIPASGPVTAKAAYELYAKYKPAEVADTQPLFFYAGGPGWLHSNKEINTFEQLKGLRIRSTGPVAEGVRAVGGDAMSTPMADVYEAAQKNTIDAAITPGETLEGWKHMEVFKYSVFSPFLHPGSMLGVFMNKEKFESLPEDLRAAFESVQMDAGVRGAGIMNYADRHAMELAEAGGLKFSEWSDTEKAKFLEALEVVRSQRVEDLNGRGLPGEAIVTTIAALVEEANKIQFELWEPGVD